VASSLTEQANYLFWFYKKI